MFGFSLAPSMYCIVSADSGESAGVIWERTFASRCLPVPSSRYEKSVHCKTMEYFTKCNSDCVTVHHQSVNQSIFKSPNIPGEARLSGATGESVSNSRIDETVQLHQWAVGCAAFQRGRPSQRHNNV